ncbi:MAG: hypothetical protein ACK5IC_00250, partial [Moheibacter sp.]
MSKKNTWGASRFKLSLNILLVLFSTVVLTQEKVVHARIIIDLDNASAEGIYITNSRTKMTSITDLTGSFSIKAQVGDSLLIRSTFYESRRFYLSKNLIKKELISIHLNLQPITLDEAVFTRKLTGYLEDDVKHNPSKNQIAKLYKELGVNPDASKLRDSSDFKMWKDISPFHLNVEKVVEILNGDLRRRQNLYQYEGMEQIIVQIRDYFGDHYFINDLKIPKEKIREFIFFAYSTSPIPSHFSNKNYLNIMAELSKIAPLYITRLNKWNAPLL